MKHEKICVMVQTTTVQDWRGQILGGWTVARIQAGLRDGTLVIDDEGMVTSDRTGPVAWLSMTDQWVGLVEHVVESAEKFVPVSA